MNREERGILRSLSYSELFDFPLTEEEIFLYFMGETCASAADLKKSLSALIDLKTVSYDPDTGFYFFPGGRDLIEKRLRRAVSSQKLLKKAKTLSGIFSFLPWVRFVAVTGSLSVGNSEADDDIDLLIVTSSGRLWLTRFLIFTFLKLANLKRDDRKARSGAVCINVWVDEENLETPVSDRDLVVAREIIQMKTLVDKGNVRGKFLMANAWLHGFFPNFPIPTVAVGKAPWHSLILFFPLGYFFDKAENPFFQLQSLRIRRKFSGNPFIKIGIGRLWQHPTDTRGRILWRFEDSLRRRLGYQN